MYATDCHRCLRILFLILLSLSISSSCKTKQPIAAKVSSQTKPNTESIKKQEEDFQSAFKTVLKGRTRLVYPELLDSFYREKNYQPVLLPMFIADNKLQILLDYLKKSPLHGLDPKQFEVDELQKQLAELNSKKRVTGRETYRNKMELELTVANALIKYSIALQFGLIDPVKVNTHYTTPTAHPDKAYLLKIFNIVQLEDYLDSLQPNSKPYLVLQKVLMETRKAPIADKDTLIRKLIVNLERLRWKNVPAGEKIVMVNIADFSLDVMDKGKSMLHMKVCVGEPGNRETPQLSGMIHSVQVNPVWNIPQSIVTNEISKQAAEDPHYLSNNNINVYRGGRLIEDPESIDWFSADVKKYSFQQQPGVENALGKIKFLFKNGSSVYLHDTPVQKAFDRKMRAISHGCVRVEKPRELAYALFGKGEKYELIKKAMKSGYPRAKFVALPVPIPIWLTYFTAWADEEGRTHFCNDVYQLDPILYQQLLAAE